MAQLFLAAAGAAIGGSIAPAGFALLGMTGAQLGWVAGSMLGAALVPKQRSYGPRLDELRVTGTEYGGGIAWIAGAPRVAGDLVWASDRREIANTQEAGKGGGSEYTSYTYELDALYLLADQPNAIVTRIWDNGKLIWTNLVDADDASRIASEKQKRWNRITIYDGHDAQQPDPVYEAAVTNAPAYTRRTTVFIEGLQLGSSGAIPNLTFEVASYGDTNPNFERRYQVTDTGRTFASSFSTGLGSPAILSIIPKVRVGTLTDSGTEVYVFDLDGTSDGTSTRTSAENFPSVPYSAGSYEDSSSPVGILDNLPVRVANHYHALGTQVHMRVGVKTGASWNTGILPDLLDCLPSGRYLGDTIPCSDGVHMLVYTAPTSAYFGGAVLDTWHLIKRNGTAGEIVSQGAIAVARDWQTRGCVGAYMSAMLEDDLKHVWYGYGAGQGTVEMLKIEADGVLRVRDSQIESISNHIFTNTSTWAEGGYCVVISGNSYQAFRRVGDIIGQVTLEEVVEALCERATMPAGTYDATALATITQPVRALAVTNGSVRQALEILQTSHGFEAYCTDKLYFKPRGSATTVTIAAGDLAAGDNEATDEPFSLSVNADLEIPNRVSVVYKNMSADQINGTETSDRGPSIQDSIQVIQLAIGLLPDEARGVANATARDAWASRLISTITLPLAYSAITPTDTIWVPDSDGTLYRMRVVRRTDSVGIISLELLGDDATITVVPMATDNNYVEQVSVEVLASTELLLLDIPLLREEDDSPGIYLAVRGSTNKWPGCVVYGSNDGATFSDVVADISDAAVLGETTSILSAASNIGIWDHGSSVLVNVGPGQLSSVTEAQIQQDAGLNALLIGDEIVRFTTAVLQSASPNIYKVSNLLREQKGTSSAGHAVGDPVVLLRSRGIRRIAMTQADIGSNKWFKAVTRGELLSEVEAVSIVPSNRSQLMMAPVDLRATRDANSNVVFSWKRRTRYEPQFVGPSGSVVPLDASNEVYDIEILNGTSVVRTTRVTTPAFEYSASQQVSDFGGIQGSITARVYQVGDAGRGQPLTASAGGAAGAALIRTLTLGGTFTVGLTISVRAGNSQLAAYLTKSADTNLSGIATELAAAISGGGTGYSAVAVGSAITVTGPLGVLYTLTAEVSGASSMYAEPVQTSAMASAGSPYRVRLTVGARFAWGAGGTVDAGSLLRFTLRVNGVDLPAVQYLVSYAQSAQQALVGLQYAFNGSAIEAAGYSISGNSDAFGYYLSLVRNTVGYINAVVVDTSSGGFFIASTLSTIADQGVDPIVADRPQISDLAIYGSPVVGEIYSAVLTQTNVLTPTPVTYSYTAISGDDVEDIAVGLAAVVNAAADYDAAASDRGLGGLSNAVRITGALTVPTAGSIWTLQPIIGRAITVAIS